MELGQQCTSDYVSGALEYLNILLSKSVQILSQRKWYQPIEFSNVLSVRVYLPSCQHADSPLCHIPVP